MDGIHDMGGMEGFGRVVREVNEPIFHHAWERRVWTLAIAWLAGAFGNIDEFRHAIERIPPADYLTLSYYERWLRALEGLSAETRISARKSELMPVTVSPFDSDQGISEEFVLGDQVSARLIHRSGHTRLPRYIRGRQGRIVRDLGEQAFPDTNAHHAGKHRQHLYTVEFSARELFGPERNPRDTVRLDLWADYLERVK
ncbi:MAG: nitrile hydratase subunit beta [Deltaproteobacteria bacterium]|nr:nitrile hydratase subunit beta [Deltaproteobacteria bacterium]